MKYFDNMDDSAMIELMEQIRAEDEAYASFYNSADEFCSCAECEDRWLAYDCTDF